MAIASLFNMFGKPVSTLISPRSSLPRLSGRRKRARSAWLPGRFLARFSARDDMEGGTLCGGRRLGLRVEIVVNVPHAGAARRGCFRAEGGFALKGGAAEDVGFVFLRAALPGLCLLGLG